MKRKTRFNDGGMNKNPFQGEDVDPFSAVRGENGGIKKGDIPDAEPRESVGRMEGLPSKPKSFGQAFSEAEDGSIFMWNGKSYKKEYAKTPSKAPSLKDVPGGGGRGSMPGRTASDDIMRDVGGGGRGRSMGRTAADMDTYTSGKPRAAEIPETVSRGDTIGKTTAEKVQDEVSDNTKKALAALGVGAAGAGAGYLGKRLLDLRRAREARELVSKEAAAAFSKPQAREIGSKVPARASQATKERAEALKEAEPILKSRPDTKAARASRTRRTEEDMGIEFSKGGTASRRADGCAQRGKTRGKMY